MMGTDVCDPGDPAAHAEDLREVPQAVQTRRVWWANVRQDLLAPVSNILELAEMLRQDARKGGQADFLADLEKIHLSGRRLLERVRDLLQAPQSGHGEVLFGRQVRHDLAGPLNGLIGYCEEWLTDNPDRLVEEFVPDLREIHALSWQILERLDELIQAAPGTEPAVPGAAVPEMVRDVFAYLPAPAAGDAAAGTVEPGSLLVVDDTEINRDLLSRRLRRDGHTVTVAENGRQALELLRSVSFDLVLLDIIMPEANGLQVLEQLKADPRLRYLPVIMISALDEVGGVARCLQMGADDYLSRPFNPMLLRARIRACLEKKRLRDREARYLEQIEREQRRSDELLRVILPGQFVKELKETNGVRPRRYEDVAVLFADIVGFTPFCDGCCPEKVVAHLQRLVESWEDCALRHDVEKIKTIGDAFMAAGGLLYRVGNPVLNCVRCGLEMIAATQALPPGWNLRVGVHIGQVVAGVIGHRQFLFDLWGDTVNTAARLESHGVPGHVTLSRAAWQRIQAQGLGESLGLVQVKGKGPLEVMRLDRLLD
jgi:CheY-like chemotaxis protein